MYVMKFGEVSVGEASRLKDIVNLCKSRPGGPLVVVCTTAPSVTDALIGAARSAAAGDEAAVEQARRDLWSRHRALAEKVVTDDWEHEALYREWAALLKTFDRVTRSIATLRDHSPRGIDAVAALGERLITHLVAVVLRQGGIAARVVDAAELIVTDDHFGAARPLPHESAVRVSKRLQPLLQAGIVPVITGYIGATREGMVTTLGRIGGDYTASFIGAVMGAEEVWIWTDVNGILTADPKIVQEARTLPELSYQEATDIATFGAEVLHPRTLAPIVEQGIALRIRNALRGDHPGTRILARPEPTPQPARTIISARGLGLVTLTANGDGWNTKLATRVLTRLEEAGVDILTLMHNFSERGLTFAVRGNDAAFACEVVNAAFEYERVNGAVREATAVTPVALVTVISAPNGNDLAPHILAALGRAGAHIISLAQSTASAHVSFILPDAEMNGAVRVLHRELGLG
jgi:aspartate kinase